MEKIIKFSEEKKTIRSIMRYVKDYDTIILDLQDKNVDAFFLNYLLKVFRLCKSNDTDIVFISKSKINPELKKYIRIFNDYEQYKKMRNYISFQAKIYMNDEAIRNIIKDVLLENGFITKERNESNFVNKEHDCGIKDIYIVDYDRFKKKKTEEIKKIKEKNIDTIVILVISKESREAAIKMVELVDAIIEKPINTNQFISTIRKLADQSVLEYENIQLNNKLKNMLTNIENEISLAKDIQQSFLPENNVVYNGYKISYIFEPSQGIGGDFCDLIKLKDSKFAVVFADISGHGIPASLLSSMLRVFIRNNIKDYENTAKFIENINEQIIKIFPKGKFVSMFYMLIDTINHTVKYCKASQEPALLLQNNSVIELETEGQVLGVFSKKDFPTLVNFEQREAKINKSDVILLYTDGITEAQKASTMYGIEKLKKEFLNNGGNLKKIRESLKDYYLEDDLTLFSITRE